MSSLLMPEERHSPPQTKSIVPIDKPFSVVLSQPVIRSVSVTVQPQNYKASTVPAVQTTAKSLKTSTAQLAHQLTKSMKRRRSLHTQDHLPQCNYICVLVTVRLNIDRDR